MAFFCLAQAGIDGALAAPPPPPPPPYTGTAPASFNCVEVGGNASSGRLYTKLKDTAISVDIVALRTDRSVETNYVTSGAKPITVELFDDSAGSCATASAVASMGVSFSSRTGRQTVGGINVSGVAGSLRCRVRDSNQSPAVVGCSSDNFAVRPKQFTLSTTAALNPAADKMKAGTAFPLAADPGVSTGYRGLPVLDEAKVVDHNAALVAAGTLIGGFSAASGGAAPGSFQYSDVGRITFNADAVTDGDFTSVDQSGGDCVAARTSNTADGGKYGCLIGSAAFGPLGRFYPDHYEVTAKFAAACNDFTYMGQPALGIELDVSARSSVAGKGPLSRYTAGYAPLATLDVSGVDGGTVFSPLNSRLDPDLPAFTWAVGSYAKNANYSFDRLATGPDGPFDHFTLKVKVTDPDGAKITRLNNADVPASESVFSPETRIRFGVLEMTNAYGSELLNLPVPVQAKYWNGASFVRNTDDNCTALTAANVALSYAGGLNATNMGSSHIVTPAKFSAGVGTITLTKPVPAATGSVDLLLNLSGAGAVGNCRSQSPGSSVTAGLAHLKGKWCGSNYDRDPVSRATFGIHKTPLIYRRENF